ncbi:c-type cytochrome [Magnetococcus sp. PR-3]|uniref:c-type cytochrome n=1 Tax=Magnetococcus sp. PR-3 TaxID=3120355 RepID=UPI002FCE45A3
MLRLFIVLFSLTLSSQAMAMQLLDPCRACHKDNGQPVNVDTTPLIGSQNVMYIMGVLQDYAMGKRPTEVAVHKEIPQQLHMMYGAHYSQQPWVSPWQAVDNKRADRGKELIGGCERCHREGGKVQYDDNPRLAGQRMDYLRLRMAQFRKEGRTPPQPKKMRSFMKELSDEQIEDVIHFYARNR